MSTGRVLTILALCAGLAAFDTPLILSPPAGSMVPRAVIVNPATGAIQFYEISTRNLTEKSFHSFMSDLLFLTQLRDPVSDWQALRTGTNTSTPTYEQMLKGMFPKILGKPFAERVMAGEDAFWNKDHKYDGKVCATLGQTALFLVLPQTCTILVYAIINDKPTFVCARNYRTELYIPEGFNTKPTREELLTWAERSAEGALKEWAKEQRAKIIAARDANVQAGNIDLKDSDPWVSLALNPNQERLVLLDFANARLATYDYTTRGKGGELKLESVRNVDLDLEIPASYNAEPTPAQVLDALRFRLRELGIREASISVAYLRGLAAKRQLESRDLSPFQPSLVSSSAGPTLLLDIPGKRKLAAYSIFGDGRLLQLTSFRDYTIEAGAAMYYDQRQLEVRATELFESLTKTITDTEEGKKRAMDKLKVILVWHPHLYKQCEENRRVRKVLEGHPEWQPAIEKAMKEAQRLDDEAKDILEELKKGGQ